ncbi:MAG: UpxY family transcription antiterminator [Tannerella sp.]|jgi:transcription antitermination factor NusG|nr:UpxY family transcription antiterminator [Tannerella sp.]
MKNENENENKQPAITSRRNVVNWHVLYTSSRMEKKVKTLLDRHNIENYLPLHRSPRMWSDRVKMIDKPLFPSYIFVRCRENTLQTLLQLYGVSRILYYNGRPAIVHQKEIDAIHIFIKQATELPLCIGEEAEILCGLMRRVSGRVQKIGKKYLLLYIEPLGATVSVNLHHVASANRIK